MVGIDVKAYCVSGAMPKSDATERWVCHQGNVQSEGHWIHLGHYNLETSWPVCVSQTRTREPVADQHANSPPLGEYSGQSIHMWSSNSTRWTGQCRASMNIIWKRKTEARWRRSSHRMPGVNAGNIHIPPWSPKNTCIPNLRDPAYAKFAVIPRGLAVAEGGGGVADLTTASGKRLARLQQRTIGKYSLFDLSMPYMHSLLLCERWLMLPILCLRSWMWWKKDTEITVRLLSKGR